MMSNNLIKVGKKIKLIRKVKNPFHRNKFKITVFINTIKIGSVQSSRLKSNNKKVYNFIFFIYIPI